MQQEKIRMFITSIMKKKMDFYCMLTIIMKKLMKAIITISKLQILRLLSKIKNNQQILNCTLSLFLKE